MKRFVAALLIGLAVGYGYGYNDATVGNESIVSRALDHFGASKLRKTQAERERRLDEAGKP
jgi:hypothetical protein